MDELSRDVLSGRQLQSPLSAVPGPHISGQRAGTHKSDLRHRRTARKIALSQQGYDSYADYLRSAHWRRLRIRYQADESLPQVCVCGEVEIQLHHTTYERIGQELLTDLVPLCARCHALVHVLERRGEIALNLDGLFDEQRAAGYRAQLEAIADIRRAERAEDDVAAAAELGVMSIDQLEQRARQQGVDISSEMRVIRHRIAAMERKVRAAAPALRAVS